MTNPFNVPLHKIRIAGRMSECLHHLGHLMMPRIAFDARGPYIAGFYSQAMEVRSLESPEIRTWAWYEAEGARLIFRALALDGDGDRALAVLAQDDPVSSVDNIIARAESLIGDWCRFLPGRLSEAV